MANATLARQNALRESRIRFRATFEQAAVGIAHVGLDGQWLRVNRKLCEIVGYDKKELEALTFQEITFDDDLSADITLAEQLKAGTPLVYVSQLVGHKRITTTEKYLKLVDAPEMNPSVQIEEL